MKKIFDKYYILFFWLGLILLLVPTALRNYLLIPFPGSQDSDYFFLCWYFNYWKIFIFGLGALLFIYPFIKIFRNGKWFKKIILSLLLIFIIFFIYVLNIFMNPEKMFHQPKNIIFKNANESSLPLSTIVIGINDKNKCKVYPLEFIVYHHQVQDSLGNIPVLVTYCGMCHSGRVFSPVVDGNYLRFKIVGMKNRNALFEDTETKSWWYQETGEAFYGKLKGKQMQEIYCEQSTLQKWLEKYPETLIMQPDSSSTKKYEQFKNGFSLSATDMVNENNVGEWNPFVLVLGITVNGTSKAYQWKKIVKEKTINDNVKNMAVLVALENDSVSFHVWKRTVNGKVLEFKNDTNNFLTDTETNSKWNFSGHCLEGELKGARLEPINAYQEYWKSWKYFHKESLQ